MMKSYFQFDENQTNLRTEIIGGITTFLAMMYIIVVNPGLLSQAGMPFSAVLTATVVVSAFSSIAMGIYARNPIAVAPGMGLNTFFTFSVVLGMKVPWETALGAVFWSGIVFLLLSIFNIRTYIVQAIPKQLRYGVAAGIGLFITLNGFINADFIVTNPDTLTARGELNVSTITFLVGLAITSILLVRKFKGALIIGIVITTILTLPIGRWWGDETLVLWNGFFSTPDFTLLFKLDLIDSLKLSMFSVVFGFLFTDMFDSLSTFVGVAEAGRLMDETGEPRNIKESLIVDGFSTTISGLLGSSPGTSYIESAAGIEEGGRTGMTAIVTGLLFLPFMFFSPLLSIVPAIATAPALVLVGVFMMTPAKKINWNQLDDAIPAFLAMLLIPLCTSITQGIIWGFLSWTIIKLSLGKHDEVSPMLMVIDVFCIIALIF
jgi:AGZA family xanthine/uracil permease-like MFS transporter